MTDIDVKIMAILFRIAQALEMITSNQPRIARDDIVDIYQQLNDLRQLYAEKVNSEQHR